MSYIHCTDCKFAAGPNCARVPMFTVAQPKKARCLRGVYRPLAENEVCSECEGGGWEAYGIGHGDPHFRECSRCGNPEGHECP